MKALQDCLSTDFKRVFYSGTMSVGCYSTSLEWGHIPFEALSEEYRERWRQQVANFLSLKQKPVLFVRLLESNEDVPGQYARVHRWLEEAGYQSFQLVCPVKGECEQTDHWFPMTRKPDHEGYGSWQGSTADWDEFFEHVRRRFHIEADTVEEEEDTAEPRPGDGDPLFFRSDIGW